MLFELLTLSPKVMMSLTILQIYHPQQLRFFMEVIPWLILLTGSVSCHSHILGSFVFIHNHYFLSFFFYGTLSPYPLSFNLVKCFSECLHCSCRLTDLKILLKFSPLFLRKFIFCIFITASS